MMDDTIHQRVFSLLLPFMQEKSHRLLLIESILGPALDQASASWDDSGDAFTHMLIRYLEGLGETEAGQKPLVMLLKSLQFNVEARKRIEFEEVIAILERHRTADGEPIDVANAVDSFDENDGEVLATVSIEGGQSLSITESERLRLLNSLHKIDDIEDEQAKLDRFVHNLVKQFNLADRAGMLLYRDKELLPISFTDPGRCNVSFTLARRAVIQKKALLWQRSAASLESMLIPSLAGVMSAIYVPIVQRRRVRGMIYLHSASMSDEFDTDDLNAVADIVNEVGCAIRFKAEISDKLIPRIFVSYSRKNSAIVRQLAADLRRQPISVWYDDERLHAGKDWQNQLDLAIRLMDAFVLVMSQDSLNSDYVSWEIDRALHHQKPFFILKYQDCMMSENLKAIQYIDIETEAIYDAAVAELTDELYALIERNM